MGNTFILIAVGVAVVGFISAIFAAATKGVTSNYDTNPRVVAWWVTAGCFVAAFILALIGALPEYRLYRATIEKRILVEDALAQRDAAVNLAEAEVNRARGVAEANIIVAQSITEQYLRYLFIDQLDEIDGQVIYVPTEAGIPILEANRLAPTVGADE